MKRAWVFGIILALGLGMTGSFYLGVFVEYYSRIYHKLPPVSWDTILSLSTAAGTLVGAYAMWNSVREMRKSQEQSEKTNSENLQQATRTHKETLIYDLQYVHLTPLLQATTQKWRSNGVNSLADIDDFANSMNRILRLLNKIISLSVGQQADILKKVRKVYIGWYIFFNGEHRKKYSEKYQDLSKFPDIKTMFDSVYNEFSTIDLAIDNGLLASDAESEDVLNDLGVAETRRDTLAKKYKSYLF